MSSQEVAILRRQIAALEARVVRLETYVKIVCGLVTVIPTAIQIYNMFHK
jgi:hypothetical protein